MKELYGMIAEVDEAIKSYPDKAKDIIKRYIEDKKSLIATPLEMQMQEDITFMLKWLSSLHFLTVTLRTLLADTIQKSDFCAQSIDEHTVILQKLGEYLKSLGE